MSTHTHCLSGVIGDLVRREDNLKGEVSKLILDELSVFLESNTTCLIVH